MAPNDIARHLRHQPFQPLRSHLSNGAAYEVFEPWHAGLAVTEMYLGLDRDADGIPTRSIYCDTRHITQIAPMPTANGGNGEGGIAGE